MNARMSRLIHHVSRALGTRPREGKRLWYSTPWTRRAYEAKMMRAYLADKAKDPNG